MLLPETLLGPPVPEGTDWAQLLGVTFKDSLAQFHLPV